MTRSVFALRVEKKRIAAKELMDWAHVRHVPVINAAREVVGMVNHRDLLVVSLASRSHPVGDVEGKRPLWTIPIAGVMRSPVTTILPAAPIQRRPA